MILRLILALAAICWMFLVANAWAGEDCSGPILQWSKGCVAHMNDTPKWGVMFLSNHGSWWRDPALVFASKQDCERAIPNLKPEGLPKNAAGDAKCIAL